MKLAKVDGIAHITLYGVDLEVGYEVEPADPTTGLPVNYYAQYVLAGNVDIFELVDAIPGAWDEVERLISKAEADR